MAIVVEEDRPRVNITQVLMWFTVLAVVVFAVYYIFFARPEIIDITAPTAFTNLDPLAEVNLNPDDLINSPSFKSLKKYITLPEPGNAGRINPFVPPQ